MNSMSLVLRPEPSAKTQALAVKAETLLEKSQLPKLTDFYRALVDAYPGSQTQLRAVMEESCVPHTWFINVCNPSWTCPCLSNLFKRAE